MNEELEHWLKGEEARSLLEKFSDSDKVEVQTLLNRYGLKARELLRDHRDALRYTKLDKLLVLLQEQGGLSDKLASFIAGISPQTLETWSDAELRDITLASQRIASWKLPPDREDPSVAPLLARLKKELKVYEPQFRKKAVTLQIEGSFYFGDPSPNADLDAYFLVANETDEHPDLSDITKELPRYMGIRMDTAVINLADIEQFLEQFDPGRILIEHDTYLDTCATLFCSEIIPLPGADKRKINARIQKIRKAILALAKKKPLFQTLVIASLMKMETSRTAKPRRARQD